MIEPVLSSLGFCLVDCEYTNEQGWWILRLYIERPEGNVTLDDCVNVSRSLEGVLDVENVVPNRYSLEVSSPGLNRPLRKKADFEKFKGKMARFSTVEPINGRGNYFGTLLGINGEDILINVDGTEYKVPLNMVAKARLEYKI